ncbi:hypothetical protein F6X40_17530 [Paraburkholderia sp. UCT31]|uniref:hypothetical protein n=1 Tax=Paraburkholderia sp. UCT31 TaxID=2615209 RepID=UPI001654CFAE|nr:hypothetical protein [Paraburkholderia sp. UCT31]MBC8738562.1 hypothetical protein [Paraburkholderia sp. UCT31]
MASNDRKLRKAASQLMEMLSNVSGSELKALMERLAPDAPPPEPVPEAITTFLEEEGQQLTRELSILARFGPAAPRILTYERLGSTPSKSGAKWKGAGVQFAPPVFFHAGSSALRDKMDETLRAAGDNVAVSLWIGAIQSRHVEGFFVFLRDHTGGEALYAALASSLRRIATNQSEIEQVLSEVLPTRDGPPDASKIVQRWLREDSCKNELAAACRAAEPALEVSDPLWQAITTWLSQSHSLLQHMVDFAERPASSCLEESHLLLNALARALTDLFEKVTLEREEAFAALEKQHEKKLRRLRSDLEKSKTLSEGVRRRAEKAELENRKLLNRLKEKGTAPQQAPLAGASASPRRVSPSPSRAPAARVQTLGQALDEMFG